MGKIVGAFGTSHVLMNREGVEDKADRVLAGMLEIRKRVAELDPDIVVLIGNDHFINLDLAHEIPFAIPMVEEYASAGDMGLPPVPFKADPGFAAGLADYVNSNGFDVAIIREYRACHGIATPSFIVAPPGSRMKLVPLLTNTLMGQPPTPARCYALGKRLGEYIENVRPAYEKVVVIGTGGLSHWVAVEGQGTVNFDYDQRIFDLFASGKAEEISKLSTAEVLRNLGNGGMEIINWMVMAGAVHGKPGHKLYYEAIPQWFTGMSGLQMAV
ncbi:MAG: hypothetical protein AB7T07_06035 [Steroidobacteraceae bacterium]